VRGGSPARLELPGDLGEPVPGRRRCAGRPRDQLGDGRVRNCPRFALQPAVPVGEPPLGVGQPEEARVVRPAEKALLGPTQRSGDECRDEQWWPDDDVESVRQGSLYLDVWSPDVL